MKKYLKSDSKYFIEFGLNGQNEIIAECEDYFTAIEYLKAKYGIEETKITDGYGCKIVTFDKFIIRIRQFDVVKMVSKKS